DIGDDLRAVLDAAAALGVPVDPARDDRAFVDRIGRAGIARVRLDSPATPALRDLTLGRPELAVLDDTVTASGRVELRYWLAEQSVSMTLHRFGNLDRAFVELAEDLKSS
ncbi:hypothetical protein, partial [Gordonia sihwensis]